MNEDQTNVLIRKAEEMIRQAQLQSQGEHSYSGAQEAPPTETPLNQVDTEEIFNPEYQFDSPSPDMEEQRQFEQNHDDETERVMQRVEILLAEINANQPQAVQTTQPTIVKTEVPIEVQNSPERSLDDSVMIIGDGNVPAPMQPIALPTEVIDDLEDEVIFVNELPGVSIPMVDLSSDCHIQITPRKRKNAQPLLEPKKSELTPAVPPPPQIQSPSKSLLTCPICMDELTRKTPYATLCGHIFCKTCVTQCIKMTKKCPMCNTKLTLKQCHPLYLPLSA